MVSLPDYSASAEKLNSAVAPAPREVTIVIHLAHKIIHKSELRVTHTTQFEIH